MAESKGASKQEPAAPPGASAEVFRQFAEAMPHLVWMTLPDGYHDYYNQRWYAYTGMTYEDTRGENWKKAFHPDDLPHTIPRWQHSLATGEPYETEYRCRRHDGQWRWFLGRAHPVRDAEGRIIRWFGTCTDIHEQKLAAERQTLLAQASELLSSSLEPREVLARLTAAAVPAIADWCAVDLLAEEGRLVRAAIAHRDRSKVEPANAIARRAPLDVRSQSGIAEVLRTGRSLLVPEVKEEMLARFARNEEHLVYLRELGLGSIVCAPLEARGQVVGVLVLVNDVGSRHFDEADRGFAEDLGRHAGVAVENARLHERLLQNERALQEVVEALGRSNRELDQFAYVASHDLKAPLRGIANLSQWIEEDLEGQMTGETREQMALLRGRVHRLEALIDGILHYSRAGRARSKKESVDVGALLAEIVELLAPPEGAIVRLGEGMPVLETERAPLQQVFMNLLGNAFKHARGADPRVEVTVEDAGPHFCFSVRDSGPGIAPEYHARIWGIFQTLEARDTLESTGIGLSVVQKIVEGKGGRAWVESAQGEGATFRFTWPKQETTQA